MSDYVEKFHDFYQTEQGKSGFQIGDRVLVKQKAHSKQGGWGYLWLNAMDDLVGQIGTIKDIYTNSLEVRFRNSILNGDFYLPFFILERIETEPSTPKSFNIQFNLTKNELDDLYDRINVRKRDLDLYYDRHPEWKPPLDTSSELFRKITSEMNRLDYERENYNPRFYYKIFRFEDGNYNSFFSNSKCSYVYSQFCPNKAPKDSPFFVFDTEGEARGFFTWAKPSYYDVEASKKVHYELWKVTGISKEHPHTNVTLYPTIDNLRMVNRIEVLR